MSRREAWIALPENKNREFGKREFLQIDPPQGWSLAETRSDGAAWYNKNRCLAVIASASNEADEKTWLHVSVSHSARMPTYEEMALVRKHFIGDDLYALMVFPPKEYHVNIHKYCLHLWSCLVGEYPLPEFTRGTGGI